jgi:hypothetical protein
VVEFLIIIPFVVCPVLRKYIDGPSIAIDVRKNILMLIGIVISITYRLIDFVFEKKRK